MMSDESPVAAQGNADDLVARMTLEEKAALTVGRDFWTTEPIERLQIPSIWLSDGPTGLRKAPTSEYVGIGDSLPATCFPTESALAASWDVDLVGEIGRALGEEAQAQGVQVLLAPGANLKRSPLGGRNFEYFSEDPVLTGELASAFIRGVQEQGVGTSLKHFAANEQETGRMYADSVVDERTLRELYLRAFEIAVHKGKPWTLMAAYNMLNGTYCTENRVLLHDILKGEWQYDGIVMSDWLAVNDRAAGIEAGLHLQMPGGPTAESIVQAVREGRLDERRLDEVVRELLAFILRLDRSRREGASTDLDGHHQLARRAAGACAVLLKNEDGLLPLDAAEPGDIALLGAFAREPRYQGSGSSQVRPTRVETLYDELNGLLEGRAQVRYAAGYSADAATDASLLEEARRLANGAAVAVVCVGLPGSAESEGVDRSTLHLPASHNALVEAVLEVQPRTVVVLTNGSAVAMPWAPRVPAIVEGWLAGQGGGGALAEVLLGRVNPSGKLPETFPARLEDTPPYPDFPADPRWCLYGERLFTGYRWYDTRDVAPLFPFGHGLSYTTFDYSSLRADGEVVREGGTLALSCTVRNTGPRAGREVVQLYVHEREPRLPRPQKELRAFRSVWLEPGESAEVGFELSGRDFAFYDPDAHAWTVTDGPFDLLVGASSRDIRLAASVRVKSDVKPPARLDRLSPVGEWLRHPVGRTLLASTLQSAGPIFGLGDDQEAEPMRDAFLSGLPLSKLVLMGRLSEADLQAMLHAVNQGE